MKDQNYHISIENLETKQKENFLLAQGETPTKIIGSDNLAPKYQIGKMEYGDMTNHSVWAQSDWSEGGGKKYWEPYKDGYNIFPFTKKYFSKSGLRTIDYPGELRLGANANIMASFPENNGYIKKIETYGTMLLVAVQLSDSFKIYSTSNKGVDWAVFYDSSEQTTQKYGSFLLSEHTELTSLSVGNPSSADVRMTQRAVPSTGELIPLNEWDLWWEDRRSVLGSVNVYLSAKRPGAQYGVLLKIPLYESYVTNYKYNGEVYVQGQQQTVVSVEDDYDTHYAGTVESTYWGGNTRYQMIDVGANIDRFFPGQEVSIFYDGVYNQTREIIGRQGTKIVFLYSIANLPNCTVKLNPTRLVLTLDQDPLTGWTNKDFQGNSVPLHVFDYNIKNMRNNVTSFVPITSGSNGLSSWRIVSNNLYDSFHYQERIRKNNPSDSLYLYLYYVAGIDGGSPTRDGISLDSETRKYVVIATNQGDALGGNGDYQIGDKIGVERVAKVDGIATTFCGVYQRQNTSIRTRDLFLSQNNSIYRNKYPQDLAPYNYNQNSIWCSVSGDITAYYIDEANRTLSIASRNTSVIQSYVYEITDATSGSASSIMNVGENRIDAIVKHNESTYIGTNFQGRIYRWNGQSYNILERFDLDPITNSTNITSAAVYQNKILVVDNYNGNIMSYDPEAGLWDDLCSPEYLKTQGDLITALGVIGGSLIIGTNKRDNLVWEFDESGTSGGGNVVSSWYSADMPAMDKKGLYVQVLANQFIKSAAKIRVAVQFDYQDDWYYLSKERGNGFVKEPTEMQEVGYADFKSVRAFYFFFPFNAPKFKTARYRLEIFGGQYRTKDGGLAFFRPVINNIDLFYILADPKEIVFNYGILLENRIQTLGGAGSNEIGKHRDKLEFLMDIWNNDSTVRIAHVDGKQYHCIPFKPQQLAGGGMSVSYSNLGPSRKDLNELSYFVNMMFKNINKIDNYGK